jgi:hypothetical protein
VKARSVALAAFAVLAAAGLTACGGSSEEVGTGVTTSGQLKALQSQLLHPHRYTLKQVKAAFATQGISLRKMRSPHGGHVIVLFDPRGHPPSGYHFVGKPPSYSFFVVFVHADAQARAWVSDGNVWVASGQSEERSVDAALHKLDQRS